MRTCVVSLEPWYGWLAHTHTHTLLSLHSGSYWHFWNRIKTDRALVENYTSADGLPDKTATDMGHGTGKGINLKQTAEKSMRMVYERWVCVRINTFFGCQTHQKTTTGKCKCIVCVCGCIYDLTGIRTADDPCIVGSGSVPGMEAGSGCRCLFLRCSNEEREPGTGLRKREPKEKEKWKKSGINLFPQNEIAVTNTKHLQLLGICIMRPVNSVLVAVCHSS